MKKGKTIMLSIGSIVYLKEGTNKLMILNRGPIFPPEEKDEKRSHV